MSNTETKTLTTAQQIRAAQRQLSDINSKIDALVAEHDQLVTRIGDLRVADILSQFQLDGKLTLTLTSDTRKLVVSKVPDLDTAIAIEKKFRSPSIVKALGVSSSYTLPLTNSAVPVAGYAEVRLTQGRKTLALLYTPVQAALGVKVKSLWALDGKQVTAPVKNTWYLTSQPEA